MHRHPAIALLLVAAIASGCKREPEAPVAVEAAPAIASEPAPASPASAVISEVDHNSPASAAPGFDTKAFAGTYAGGGTTLAVDAAGHYTLTTRAAGAGADVVTAGTWTAEADGRHVLLDPESKDLADRRFELAGNTLREAGGALVLARGS